MLKPSEWLLVILLPGLFFVLAVGLFLILRKVFQDSDKATQNPEPPSIHQPANNTRLLWMGLGLGMLAVTFALGALLLVAWNLRQR